MRASDTAEGRRAAVARGVICRVIYGTTKTPFAYRPISDLGESRRSEQMADGWWRSRRRGTFGCHNIENYLLKKKGFFALAFRFYLPAKREIFYFWFRVFPFPSNSPSYLLLGTLYIQSIYMDDTYVEDLLRFWNNWSDNTITNTKLLKSIFKDIPWIIQIKSIYMETHSIFKYTTERNGIHFNPRGLPDYCLTAFGSLVAWSMLLFTREIPFEIPSAV